ncbi:large ribosomal subunit protein eL20z-like [Typha angustifolia]|uniref:large ribosomal subunit protein eL20z-like n=1 Tax=Typha angustifolia TaxID=59011 RepID=UPI003C2D3185
MSKEEQSSDPQTEQKYGTFHGTANYSEPVMGLPQPVPPPGFAGQPPPPPPPGPAYYPHGYQAVPGYGQVVEGQPLRRLPCCGIGMGWFLFIIGFFLAAIPWYVGVFILLCVRVDYREKPGLIACVIAAILATVAAIVGATR